MLRNLIFFCCVFVVGSFVVAAQKTKPQPTPTPDERPAIQAVLEDYIKAQGDFYATPNVSAVMKFYGLDYLEIMNGESYARTAIEHNLDTVRQRLSLGSPDRRVLAARDFEIKIYGSTVATATFRISDKLGSAGVERLTREGMCTEVLSKSTGKWLIEHEHCSTVPRR